MGLASFAGSSLVERHARVLVKAGRYAPGQYGEFSREMNSIKEVFGTELAFEVP